MLDQSKIPDRHFELLPITEAALPLLCAPLAYIAQAADPVQPHSTAPAPTPAATAAAEAAAAAVAGVDQLDQPPLSLDALRRLTDALQAQWRGMLAALSRALASALAVARGERATAAAGGDGGALAAEALAASGLVAWDLCSINLLMLALRWSLCCVFDGLCCGGRGARWRVCTCICAFVCVCACLV